MNPIAFWRLTTDKPSAARLSPGALLLSLLFAMAAMSAQASTGIHPWLESGDQLVADLRVDGKLVCQINLVAAHGGMDREPGCRFHMPAGARKASLTGTLKRKGAAKAVQLRQQWGLVDAAPYTKVLYDRRLSLSDRLLEFSRQLKSLETRHPGAGFDRFSALAAGGAPEKEFADAEKRLRFSLPAELKSVLALKTEVGDSAFNRPKDLALVEQVLKGWGHKSLDKTLPADLLARYRRSVAVFTEVGDGLGALAYDPQGVRAGEPSNAWGDAHGPGAEPSPRGVWFWLHQDNLDGPTLLLNPDRRARSHEEALLSALQRFVVDGVLEAAVEAGLAAVDEDRTVWVDSAHPRALMQLHFDDRKKRLKLWLRSYDHNCAML